MATENKLRIKIDIDAKTNTVDGLQKKFKSLERQVSSVDKALEKASKKRENYTSFVKEQQERISKELEAGKSKQQAIYADMEKLVSNFSDKSRKSLLHYIKATSKLKPNKGLDKIQERNWGIPEGTVAKYRELYVQLGKVNATVNRAKKDLAGFSDPVKPTEEEVKLLQKRTELKKQLAETSIKYDELAAKADEERAERQETANHILEEQWKTLQAQLGEYITKSDTTPEYQDEARYLLLLSREAEKTSEALKILKTEFQRVKAEAKESIAPDVVADKETRQQEAQNRVNERARILLQQIREWTAKNSYAAEDYAEELERINALLEEETVDADALKSVTNQFREIKAEVKATEAEEAEMAQRDEENAYLIQQLAEGFRNVAERAKNLVFTLGKAGLSAIMKTLSKSAEAMVAPFKKLGDSARSFMKRLGSAILQGAIFRPLRNAVSGVTEDLGKVIMKNKAFASSLANLKGTVYTAVAPALNAIIPILTKIINILAVIISYVSSLINAFFGLGLASADAGKEIANTIEAGTGGGGGGGSGGGGKKSSNFASWDTIQQLTSGSSGGGGGAGGGGGGAGDLMATFDQNFADAEEALAKIKELIDADNWYGVGMEFAAGLNDIITTANKWLTETFIPWCGEFGKDLGQFFLGLFDGLNAGKEDAQLGTAIANFWNGIIELMTNFLTQTNPQGQSLGDVFGTYVGNQINYFLKNFNLKGLGEGLTAFATNVFDTITGIFTSTVDGKTLGQRCADSVETLLSNIKWGEIISSALKAGGAVAGAIATFFSDLILDGFNGIDQYFKDEIEACGGDMVNGIINGISNAIKGIGDWIYNNVVKPFVDGFTAGFGSYTPDLPDWLKKMLGIEDTPTFNVTGSVTVKDDKTGSDPVAHEVVEASVGNKDLGVDTVTTVKKSTTGNNPLIDFMLGNLSTNGYVKGDVQAKLEKDTGTDKVIDSVITSFAMSGGMTGAVYASMMKDTKGTDSAVDYILDKFSKRNSITGNILSSIGTSNNNTIPYKMANKYLNGYAIDGIILSSIGTSNNNTIPYKMANKYLNGYAIDGIIKSTLADKDPSSIASIMATKYSANKTIDGIINSSLNNASPNSISSKTIGNYLAGNSISGNVNTTMGLSSSGNDSTALSAIKHGISGTDYSVGIATKTTYNQSGSNSTIWTLLKKIIANLAKGVTTTSFSASVNTAVKGKGAATGGLLRNGKWSPIQGYAGGGSPSSAQMFFARENGMAELVGRIGSATAVMNNDQIVASVAYGVYKAVMTAFGSLATYFASIANSMQSIPYSVDRLAVKFDKPITVIPTSAMINPGIEVNNILSKIKANTDSLAPVNLKNLFREAIAESGLQANSGDIILELNGTEFARVVSPYLANNNRRLGISTLY